MRTNPFQRTTRWLIFALPLFMGAIEYLIRLALKQPDANTFFPISLVASSIGFSIALTEAPACLEFAWARADASPRTLWTMFIANMGIFASMSGVILWLYLLLASISADVKLILPWHPNLEALGYYMFLVLSNLFKDRTAFKWL